MSFRILILALIIGGIASCTFTRKVQTGLQAYEVKQYAVAAELLEKEYGASTSRQDRAQLAFLAGDSYSQLNNPVAAAKWFNAAMEDGFGERAQLSYAETLRRLERYDEAILVYQDLLKSSPNNALYRSAITLSRQAKDWKSNPDPSMEIKPMGWNTIAGEYAAHSISPTQVLFTSDRDNRSSTETYLWTGRAYSDLFVYNTNTGQVTPFSGSINSEDNEGTGVMSPDGRWLVFTRCTSDKTYDAWCRLMISEKRGNQWTEPVLMPFVQEKLNYGQPAFAANGTTLFFSCDAPNGEGGHDLYFSQSDGAGGWIAPVNLGPMINTIGDELFPSVYRDTLYFASDHHPGLGGLDIFKTWLDDRGNWAPPINLKAPVNSGGDDFAFSIDTFAPVDDAVLMTGYFTSSRNGVGAGDDIFSFTQKRITPEETLVIEEEKIIPVEEYTKPPRLFLLLRVLEPVYQVKDDPNSPVIEKVPLPNGPVIVSEGLTDQRFVTDEVGQMLLELEWGETYRVTARYRDHLAASFELNTTEIEPDPGQPVFTINRTLVLNPIFKNKEIVLENIFYDYDQWAIRDDAKPSLDQLSITLKNNPGIRILLTSHTDCRGTDEYNFDLSQKRAQAAIEYLISTGIQPKRLESKGMGESQLVDTCACEECSEAQHQANRRTTFTIID